MFISSNEKQYFHDSINELNRKIQIQAEIFQQQVATFKEENANLSKRLSQLLVSGIAATVRDKSHQEEKPVVQKTSPSKREYAKQYYWRKKAERLASGSKEKIRGYKPEATNVSENTNNQSV